jgi:hypothetical protein
MLHSVLLSFLICRVQSQKGLMIMTSDEVWFCSTRVEHICTYILFGGFV